MCTSQGHDDMFELLLRLDDCGLTCLGIAGALFFVLDRQGSGQFIGIPNRSWRFVVCKGLHAHVPCMCWLKEREEDYIGIEDAPHPNKGNRLVSAKALGIPSTKRRKRKEFSRDQEGY
eukprot:1140146-Pelagomonas_calceolata.AAC.1